MLNEIHEQCMECGCISTKWSLIAVLFMDESICREASESIFISVMEKFNINQNLGC